VVPGACHDGAEANTVTPEEAGEAEALIVLEVALVQSAPASVDALEVGQMRGGATEASPVDAAMAWTLEPKPPASCTIGGSAPKGAPVMEEVPSAPIRPMPTVATVDPLVGAGPPSPLSSQVTIHSHGEGTGSIGPGS